MVFALLLPFVALFFLFVFIVIEALSALFTNRDKARGVLVSLFALFVFWSAWDIGIISFGHPEPPEPTVATMMEQVRGDELHWNRFDKKPTRWEVATHRNVEESCKSVAIRKLRALGPAAGDAVPELIQLFNQHDDYNSGDGVYFFRSDIARALGAIGRPEAIEPMIEMLRAKSLAEDERYAGIPWHTESNYLQNGTGPQAIMMGLMLMGPEHHEEIIESLEKVRAEIELSELFNEWSKLEIDRGLRFFKASPKVQAQVVDFLKQDYCYSLEYFDDSLLAPKPPTTAVNVRVQ